MTLLLKLVSIDKLVSYIVGLLTSLSNSQWKIILDLVTQAAREFPKEKQLRLPWVKAQLANIAKERGWNLSDSDVNAGIELGIKLLRYLKILPA